MAESEGAVAALPRALAELRRGVADGHHYGAQLSIVHNGCCMDLCVGEAAPGRPMTPDHVLCWSSSVKPVAALALGLLWERGLVDFEDPVAKHVPGFATHGKGSVTVAHCLTHTAGLWGAERGATGSPQQRLAHICRQPLARDWVPGQRCGYDSPAWYVLGGVVTAADPSGRAYEQFVEEELFAPLGLRSCSVGMSAQRHAEMSDAGLLAHIYVAPRTGPREWRAVPGEDAADSVMHPCPAGNGRGPARELAGLYASLLPSADQRVLRRATVERTTRAERVGMTDELQGVDTSWSLGFAVDCILSGRHAAPGAFGHGGSQSSWAFADPANNLAVACLCNGKPGPDLHYRRVGAVSTAVYEDLGLAGADTEARRFTLPAGMGTF